MLRKTSCKMMNDGETLYPQRLICTDTTCRLRDANCARFSKWKYKLEEKTADYCIYYATYTASLKQLKTY